LINIYRCVEPFEQTCWKIHGCGTEYVLDGRQQETATGRRYKLTVAPRSHLHGTLVNVHMFIGDQKQTVFPGPNLCADVLWRMSPQQGFQFVKCGEWQLIAVTSLISLLVFLLSLLSRNSLLFHHYVSGNQIVTVTKIR
jgi:hypothetical protein